MNSLIAATILATVLCGAVQAGPRFDRRTSLDEAVAEARDRYNGRVISAQRQDHEGRDTYNIRIMTDDGRVRRLYMDAESGRFTGPREAPTTVPHDRSSPR